MELSEKDIFVFEHFDVYETSNGSFVARCILCSNTSNPFLGVHFNELYYSFALSHLPRCHGLRKDRKLYDAYHDMQCDLQATLTQDETEHHQFLLQRNNWIQMYYSLVSKSSCHPGCGDPSALNQNQALSKLASLAASLESIELHEQLINTWRSLRLAAHVDTCTRDMFTDADQVAHVSYSEGSFIGYDVFGKSSILDDTFLQHEFNDWFLLQVSATPNKKVAIPEGKATSTSNKECTPPNLWGTYDDIPLVLQQMHRDTCAFSSLASAFLYFGDKKAFHKLRLNIMASLEHVDRMALARSLLCSKKYKYVALIFRRNKLHPLIDVSAFPTLVRLCSSDGGVSHCVTIVGSLIFDSNATEPLPLCRASLDWCCDTTDGCARRKFSFVFKAVRFWHANPCSHWRMHL